MTEGAGRLFCHLGREISPLRSAAVEMTGMGGFFYNLRPKGATITLSGRAAVAPLSEAMQPFYTTCGASRHHNPRA